MLPERRQTEAPLDVPSDEADRDFEIEDGLARLRGRQDSPVMPGLAVLFSAFYAENVGLPPPFGCLRVRNWIQSRRTGHIAGQKDGHEYA